jgi:arylsulfatase A-like enzyme
MENISRRRFLTYASGIVPVLGGGYTRARALAATESAKPNILFIMTDDQAVSAMGAYGNDILRTPNMDRLAREGMRFEYAFVTNSLCAPSRVSYLTGRYSHSTGVRTNRAAPVRELDWNDPENLVPRDTVDDPIMPRSEVTFPEILKSHGYETAFIGKSHIRPWNRDRRYDYYFGFKGQGRYHNPVIAENFGDEKFEDKVYDGHVTDVLADHAIKFIMRKHDKPFCMLVCFKAPHANWEAADRFKHLFKDVRFPKPSTWDYDLNKKVPAVRDTYMQVGKADRTVDYDSYMRDYYQTLVGVDENVGRILDALDKARLTDDTVVIYTSDNGMFLGEFNMLDKRLMYEPSIRVPFLVRYPKLVPASTTTKKMVLNIDVAPTVLDLAGVPVPRNMHGRSIRPLLTGREEGWRTDWLYEYYEYPWWHRVRPFRGIRTDRYKYIHWYSTDPEQFELYDLWTDPEEIHNLADDRQYRGLRKQLHDRLGELRHETADPDLINN